MPYEIDCASHDFFCKGSRDCEAIWDHDFTSNSLSAKNVPKETKVLVPWMIRGLILDKKL